MRSVHGTHSQINLSQFRNGIVKRETPLSRIKDGDGGNENSITLPFGNKQHLASKNMIQCISMGGRGFLPFFREGGSKRNAVKRIIVNRAYCQILSMEQCENRPSPSSVLF